MHTAVSELIKENQQTVSENFAALRTLTPIISEYFDENMIMDKNEDIRAIDPPHLVSEQQRNERSQPNGMRPPPIFTFN